jgi:uncharacterized protein (TIGR03066 family)
MIGSMALFALMSGLALADDKIDAKLLVGKWDLTDAKKGQSLMLEFQAGTKIVVQVVEAGKEVKLEGTYKVTEGDKMEVVLKFMGDDIKELLIIKKLTADELLTEDSKGKSETFKKKK